MFSNSRFIAIHGLSVHYRVVMPEMPVRHRALLVASPGQSTYNWRHIVPELTEAGCQCVLCDLPGFGLSECRDDAPQDHETRAQFLWGLLDALDLEEGGQLNCWHLMAHGSACGTIATMASMQPDSAASLLMLCPMLYSPLPGFLTKLAHSPSFVRPIRAWLQRNIIPPQKFARFAARLYGAPVPERTLQQMHRSLVRLSGHEEMLRRMLIDGYRVDMTRLNDLFMPSMVLWGGLDPILGGEIPNRLRLRDFKSAEYHLLPGSGHCPAETNSRAVRDFLRGWIRELWDGSR